VQPVELLMVAIDPQRLQWVAEENAGLSSWPPGALVDVADPGAAALGQEMRRALLTDSVSEPVYLQALCDALLARALCHLLGDLEAPDRSREALSPANLARILRQIDANLDGRLRVDSLAAMAGLTRSHFSRAFQRVTGDPPQRFILKRRVCRARDLLSGSDEAIAAIAARSGFSSQAHLSSAFAREVGTTPGRYRAAFQAEASAPTDHEVGSPLGREREHQRDWEQG
jgi:AraC family transcriptional regulator